MALPVNIGLVSQTDLVRLRDVVLVAAALQKQVVRDLAPSGGIDATVDAFETLDDLPLGYWPIVIRDDIGFQAAGIHLDDDGSRFRSWHRRRSATCGR